MPKQLPIPNTGAGYVSDRSSAFWEWAHDQGFSPLILREDNKSPDLMERTARFGEEVIRLVKRVPRGTDYPENNRIVDQLVGASTSVGANYCEANDAVSGKDFKNKIGTCRKESEESMFFLRMVAASEPDLAESARQLWREAKELNLIFGAIWRKS